MQNKIVYLCGDYNIDLLKCDMHDDSNDFIDMLYSKGLYPLITKPTRISTSTSTLIDNIFTSEMLTATHSGIVLKDISDHLPVFVICDYEYDKLIGNSRPHLKRHMSVKAVGDLSLELANFDWYDVTSCNDVDDSCKVFMEVFSSKLNKHCPVRETKKHTSREIKPWLTKALINCCKKDKKLYKHFIAKRNITAETRYKTYKNKLTSVLRHAEKMYFKDLLDANKNNIKETWKIINSLTNRTKK